MKIDGQLEIILYLLAIVFVLVLCYFFSRFIARKMGTTSMSGNKIKVVERVAFGQDKGLTICNICGEYYLIGFSSHTIKILKKLDPEYFIKEESEDKPNFMKLMNDVLKKNNSK